MVDKFGFKDQPLTEEILQYRMDLLHEEYLETVGAHHVGSAEELVDGHIDIIVIAIGNLAMFGVDAQKAFDEVMRANMAKKVGKRRDGDPDGVSITKPNGWVGPDHSDNLGVLNDIYKK